MNYFALIPIFPFFIGLCGIFLNKKNLIIILMSIELILLGVNMNFLLFSSQFDDIMGNLIALFILTVAAAESSLGLALCVIHFRLRGSIDLKSFQSLKG